MKTNLINCTSTSRLILTASAAALCAFTVLTARVHASTLAYTVTDLGNLGVAGAWALGVNDSGLATGYAFTPGFATHAVQFGGVGDLGSLSGSNSYGYGINASGQIAGWSYLSGLSNPHAVRWTGTTLEDLGTLGGSQSRGYGVNASGQVAGASVTTGDIFSHAVRWTGTTPEDLGTPLDASTSGAFGINASGQVAGFSGGYAIRWTGTTPTLLNSLGGNSNGGYAINASGQVAGYSQDSLGGNHAVVWTGSTPTDLGAADPGGFGINDSGDVVFTANAVPMLYTGGTTYDLFSLLVPGSGVTGLGFGDGSGFVGNDINNLGQIAAVASYGGGQPHAVLLTPVATPEPASAVLLLGGATALLTRRRRTPACV